MGGVPSGAAGPENVLPCAFPTRWFGANGMILTDDVTKITLGQIGR